MPVFSRRSVLQAATVGGIGLIAGCSALEPDTQPPVDISILNSTSSAVTIRIQVTDDSESDEEMLFSESFDLSPYESGEQTANSTMKRPDAFRALDATVICTADGRREQFSFEASCQSESEIDEGFTIEWADDGDRGDELRYQQSRCSGESQRII